jgi:hypothetical protein
MDKTLELQRTMDAQEWAKEFVRLHGGDEELMVGWFANAIMVGFYFAKAGSKEKRLAELDIMGQI